MVKNYNITIILIHLYICYKTACNYKCLGCSNTSTNCTTCADANRNGTTCECIPGWFDDGTDNPVC